jgi:hypothetical protein
MIRILEAASASLKMSGAPVTFSGSNGSNGAAPVPRPAKTEELLHAEAFAR